MDKLAIINSIEVLESSGNGGELEYVHVENTPENVEKLKSIGACDKDIEDMTDTDEKSIDISMIGFTCTDAIYFSPEFGFITFIPDDAPDWVKDLYPDSNKTA